MSIKKLAVGAILLLLGLFCPDSVVGFLAELASSVPYLGGLAWLLEAAGDVIKNVIAGVLISLGGGLLWSGWRKG